MTEAICTYCSRTGQKAPETVADYLRCIYRSLALRYKEGIGLLEAHGIITTDLLRRCALAPQFT